jgi:hypothetical protein
MLCENPAGKKSNFISMKNTILIPILICISLHTNAQQQFDLDTTLPFSEDSIISFNNALVEDGVINSIKKSTNEIEIRLYYPWALMGPPASLFIIKKQSDKFICEKYVYVYSYSEAPVEWGYTFCAKTKAKPKDRDKMYGDAINWNDMYGDTINWNISILPTNNINWQNVLDELKDANLYSMADQTNLLDSLDKAKIKLNDPCTGVMDCVSRGTILCEVKLGSKVRNFRMIDLWWYLKNKEIKEFQQNGKIWPVFHNIIVYNNKSETY